MRFTVSGTWLNSGSATADCADPPTGDSKLVPYPSTERVTFKGTSAGRLSYRGLVGRSIFFERIGARPKVKVTVTRTATPPAGCETDGTPDCGTRTLTGVANPEFEGPFRPGRPVKLRFDFARTSTSYRFSDPFNACALPSAGPGLVGRRDESGRRRLRLPVRRPGRAVDEGLLRQAPARRSPARPPAAYKGDPGIGPGPATATLRMKVGISRKVTKSQPAFGG